MKERWLVAGMALILVVALLTLLLADFSGQGIITGMITSSDRRNMTDVNSVYSVVPITKVETGYKLSEYDDIAGRARALVAGCRSAPDQVPEPDPNEINPVIVQDLATCISAELPSGWDIAGSEGRLYMFDARGRQKIMAYDAANQEMKEQNIVYKFALDFS